MMGLLFGPCCIDWIVQKCRPRYNFCSHSSQSVLSGEWCCVTKYNNTLISFIMFIGCLFFYWVPIITSRIVVKATLTQYHINCRVGADGNDTSNETLAEIDPILLYLVTYCDRSRRR